MDANLKDRHHMHRDPMDRHPRHRRPMDTNLKDRHPMDSTPPMKSLSRARLGKCQTSSEYSRNVWVRS